MWYRNTKSLLESALRQLNSTETTAEEDWKAQTDAVETCLNEMVGMSEPASASGKSTESRYVHRPAADKLNRALPHVRAMLSAMRSQDRQEALKHGTEAMSRL